MKSIVFDKPNHIIIESRNNLGIILKYKTKHLESIIANTKDLDNPNILDLIYPNKKFIKPIEQIIEIFNHADKYLQKRRKTILKLNYRAWVINDKWCIQNYFYQLTGLTYYGLYRDVKTDQFAINDMVMCKTAITNYLSRS